jgi:hypothetical protein
MGGAGQAHDVHAAAAEHVDEVTLDLDTASPFRPQAVPLG